jgi:hypothetical protein
MINQVIKDIRLFIKMQDQDSLSLADFPSIVQSKWNFLKNNWDKSLKNIVINSIRSSNDAENAQKQINKLNLFMDSRKNLQKEINILEETTIIYNFFEVFDLIPIKILPLSKEDNALIRKTISKVSNFNKNDWIKMKREIYKAMLLVSNECGVLDADVDETYRLKPISSNYNYDLDQQDKTIFFLNHLRYIDFILADKGFNDPRSIDPFALAKVNANNPKFNIDSYNAGMMVRMNVDDTLQTLSNRYYNTPDKWLQIAIANGLQPPYIDNTGEFIPMAVNGDKNIVYLSKMNGTSFNFDKFYIGQPIYLSSNVYPTPELRLIKKISIVPVSEDVILEVEGKLDLDKYTISDGAMIKVYKKYTTNSNYFILIPTDNVPQNEMINRDELPWFLRIKEDDEIQQRVDLYLNEDKDIEISNSNDLMLSYGINNAIQALMLKFTVEAGELMRHPQFGFVGDVIGAKNINVASNRQRIVDYITSQISSDDRFDSIVSLDVQTFNNYYVINLVVRLSGGLNKIVPVSFKIPIK